MFKKQSYGRLLQKYIFHFTSSSPKLYFLFARSVVLINFAGRTLIFSAFTILASSPIGSQTTGCPASTLKTTLENSTAQKYTCTLPNLSSACAFHTSTRSYFFFSLNVSGASHAAARNPISEPVWKSCVFEAAAGPRPPSRKRVRSLFQVNYSTPSRLTYMNFYTSDS